MLLGTIQMPSLEMKEVRNETLPAVSRVSSNYGFAEFASRTIRHDASPVMIFYKVKHS